MNKKQFDKTDAVTAIRYVASRPSLLAEYREYWKRLTPASSEEYMDRWLFAVTSYMNTWQNNVTAFRRLRTTGYPLSRLGLDGLTQAVRDAGAGLHERRASALYAVDAGYWNAAANWLPAKGEPLTEYRRRLLPQIVGLGMAKISFVIEMLYPLSCDVICIDRHVLSLYGLPRTKVDVATYTAVEKDWVERCRDAGLPAPLVRHIAWDQKRRPVQWSTRYWSYVLERADLAAAGYYEVPTARQRRPLFTAEVGCSQVEVGCG